MMNAIQTDNLTKYYGRHRGIENICLSVEEGDFFGFIGPNGAGKSTTIRTLLGLLSPTGGDAHIFGKNIVRDKLDILADVGYLLSEDPTYITTHNNARSLIRRIDRDELLQEMVRNYLIG